MKPIAWPPLLLCIVGALGAAEPGIDFARDVQPILASRCLDCHGAEKPKAGLQLTSRARALSGGESGEPAIVPGQSARSSLYHRITTSDDDDVMPQKGARLTPPQIDLLKRWIDQGAEWPENVKHWAYVKPLRPPVPTIRDTETIPSRPSSASPALRVSPSPRLIVNPIDNFVLARLQQEGLSPSPPADKPRWLRRVSLDLVGLPPTPAELEAFLADTGEPAYERVVDRLLASPQYGERWARPWLDLARYADSHGFQRDDLRDLWPYRDWVIRALNADMPFDRFTIWQIAGDLLPETQPERSDRLEISAPGAASPGLNNPQLKTHDLDPLIATGFHRATATNVEAGTDQEEGRVNQVFDRVNTTAATWLGTTLECAQCHNHKYDPFTQKEYYQLFAYFNNTAQETDFATAKAKAALKFTGPYLALLDPEKEAKRVALETRIQELDSRIEAQRDAALPGRAAWETATMATLSSAAQTHPLDIADFESRGDSNHKILPDKSVLLVDDAPDRDTYIVRVKTSLTGITGFKLEALTDPSLPGNGPGRGEAERPNFVLNSVRVTMTTAGGPEQPVRFVRANASFSQAKFPVANLLAKGNDAKGGWAINPQFGREHWAILATEKPLGAAEGTTFTFTLVQNFGGGRTIGRLRLSALTGGVGGVSVPANLATVLRTPVDKRTREQELQVRDYFFAQDKGVQALNAAKLKLTQDLAALKGPQTLVMRELSQPRATSVLKRGNFLEPGERVQPGTPAALPAPKPPLAGNRLDLARWLVDRDNPLTARVTVNRWWAEFFGRGIVNTLEDFGVKGDHPTHPDLLDWLAVEFMDHGWSMKHIHRLIALSATYRQSSRITPELLARDDLNKLLGRGPRFRLDAETIRDNALAASGLLSLKQGGPPVHPYQPPGLWENKVGGDKLTYEVSPGEDAHRRGIYTVWKRGSPYPSFMNFDATARTACTVRRSRSNTPLQALTLLNDPVYVEAAAALAKRVVTERPDARDDERVRFAFQLCLTRPPTSDEAAALQRLLAEQRAVHDEHTAWQAVATALLNLDEMITKG